MVNLAKSKNIKRKNILSIGMSISLIILISVMNSTRVGATFPAEFYQGEQFTWEIDNISVGNNLWFNVSTFGFVSNWHANNGDMVSFEISDWKEINQQNYLFGDLTIGNLTISTDNQDIAFNLALSAYPWYGGLISLEENWLALDEVTPFDNESIAQITHNKQVTVLGREIAAVEILYDDGFQKSELIYEPTTGALLSTNTSSGAFWLQMHLNYSSIPLPFPTEQSPLIGSVCVVIALGVLTLKQKRK